MSEPKKQIGSVHTPFSIQTNPDWVTWAEDRIAELEKKRDAMQIRLDNEKTQWGLLKKERDALRDALRAEVNLLDITPIREWEAVRKASRKALKEAR